MMQESQAIASNTGTAGSQCIAGVSNVPVMAEPAAAFITNMQCLDLSAHFAKTAMLRETMRPFPGCLLLVWGSARCALAQLLGAPY